MRKYLVIGLLATGMLQAAAQTETFKDAYEKFRQQATSDYEGFRRDASRQYVDFMRKAWEVYQQKPAIPKPKEEEKPPVVKPKKDEGKPIESRPIAIDDKVIPVPVIEPQPAPIEPIREQPVEAVRRVAFSWMGTPMEVRFSESQRPVISACTEQALADAWERMAANPAYDNTLRDCLALRMQHQLCDWAYLQVLDQCAKACCPSDNEATLLTAYLYQQSGYKMRLARKDDKVRLLYATKHVIFEKTYFKVDGDDYYLLGDDVAPIYICKAGYPKEQSLSLWIPQQPVLAEERSPERTLTSKRYPDCSFTVTANKRLIDFYATYPTSMSGQDIMTRWAMYANTPLEAGLAKTLVPAWKEKLKGLGEKESMERLLNWVQTAFVYEYDDKVWGGDRAFFAEESLFYPYCDCEDRSILISRLVRDILGLNTILIYYPGHLAMAVAFTTSVPGDYIVLDGQRYVVCDPTYIGAPVGDTMPGMDNQTAKVIRTAL